MVNLKIANRGEPEENLVQPKQSKAKKIQLWLHFMSQLTQKIEVACGSKIQERI